MKKKRKAKSKRSPKKVKRVAKKAKARKKPRTAKQKAATKRMLAAAKKARAKKPKTKKNRNPLLGVLTGNPRGKKRKKNGGARSGDSRTEVRSPTRTSTSTKAKTTGNITVTGGAGRGATTRVTIVRGKNPGKRKKRTGKQIAATAAMIRANRGKKHKNYKPVSGYKRRAKVKSHERRVNPHGKIRTGCKWKDLTPEQKKDPVRRAAALFAARLAKRPLDEMVCELVDAPAGTSSKVPIVGELDSISYKSQAKSGRAFTRTGKRITWDHKAGDHGGGKKSKPQLVARCMRTGKPILVSRRGSKAGVSSRRGLLG